MMNKMIKMLTKIMINTIVNKKQELMIIFKDDYLDPAT